MRQWTIFASAAFLTCVTCGAVELAEFPKLGEAQPRALDVTALQAWYGDTLILKNDAQSATDVQRAEALITNLLRTTEASRQQILKQQILALKLSPAVLRAVVRHGQVPALLEARKGAFSVSIAIPGFKDKSVNAALLVPDGYTTEKLWPVILSLHGAHGNGADYLKHWRHDSAADRIKDYIIVAPTAAEGYGWGPATFGRAQISAALDFVNAHYRTDPERLYLEGTSMGGVGAKRLAAFWPDRFAALVTRSGPSIPPQQASALRNLHALPWLSLAGAQDKLIAEKYFIAEKNLATKEQLPATLDIFPDRGHESFQDKDADALAYFAANARRRAPDKLRFVSFEDGSGGQRHYFVEIAATDTLADLQSDEIVLNNSKTDDPLLKQLQTAATLTQYEALLKQAKEKGLVLESKKVDGYPVVAGRLY